MLVLVEGPDASGKTTLIDNVANKLEESNIKVKKIHASYDPKWIIREYHHKLLQEALSYLDDNYVVFLDRHWLSEYIYGITFRGKVYATSSANEFLPQIQIFRNQIAEVDNLSILCLPPKDILLGVFEQRRKADQEMWDSVDQIYDLYQKEEDSFNIIYDYTQDDYNKIAELILEEIE